MTGPDQGKTRITPERVGLLVESMVRKVLKAVPNTNPIMVWGVPRGGIPVAMALSGELPGGVMVRQVNDAAHAHLIVDDLVDSGKTEEYYRRMFPNTPFLPLIDKREPEWQGSWLVLPWEVSDKGGDQSADDIVTRLLQFIGEDPSREGLKDTPRRVLKAWREWAQGYHKDPKQLITTFSEGAEKADELVVVHNIPVISKCEHHLADMVGIAHVGYIPSGKIVGLSKLPRIVDAFARRLQVQERLTNQIADALVDGLSPSGVGVVLRLSHACMSTRGVGIQGSWTTTSAMRGALLEKGSARAEFLQLCAAAER